MAGSDRHSMAIDRRESMRLSIEQMHDEDYDMEAMGISDGFRPSNAIGYNNMMSQQTPDTRASPPTKPRPSSTAKPPATDSFALRHDGGMGSDTTSTSSSASATGANFTTTSASSVSPSTEVTDVRPESPYQGPTGPSHPYQMYPQQSRLARTASMATTSTSTAVVIEPSYAGPSGPTHPYGMYPQNIVEGSEAGESSSLPPPLPAGFPGLNNNYQRRLGPDGEEAAGIIGPDGHTEELPPYTKYPDEALARKTRPTVALSVPTSTLSISPVATASGAGGIGLATRNPEFSSQEDLNSPQSRRSIMSDLSSHQVNTAAAGAAEISEKKELKNWQKAARRKVCGIIPVWVFGIVAISFILFGIILGTVLTILKPKNSKGRPSKGNDDGSKPEQIVTLTTTYDATPLTSIPTGIPLLPQGTFALPISTPSLSQPTCLENTAQRNAWNCNIPLGPGPLQMTISPILNSVNPLCKNELILSYGDQSLNSFTYGAQAPTFPKEQPLRLVNDVEEPAKGLAWWVQIPYNKLVILRNTDLPMPNQKRGNTGQGDDGPPFFGGRRGVVQSGENAWFCYWNGTVIEAFIYPNQTSVFGSKVSSAATTTGATEATSVSGSSVPTSTGGQNTNGDTFANFLPLMPPYGRVIKIEEHRISKGPQVIPPYCQLNQVTARSFQPVLNSTGQPTTIFLNETESTSFRKRDHYDHMFEVETRDDYLIKREPSSEKTCGCVWLYA